MPNPDRAGLVHRHSAWLAGLAGFVITTSLIVARHASTLVA